MVLHDITNDAKLIKVSATSLGAEWLLERDLNVVNVVAVPVGTHELVAESHDENVLDHLLAKIVVDTEDLLLVPVWLESLLKSPGALEVLAERLLNLQNQLVYCIYQLVNKDTYNDTGDAVGWVAVLLQLLGDSRENAWWKSHVEYTVLLLSAILKLLKVGLETNERLILVILTGDVAADILECLELRLDLLRWGLDGRLDTLEELLTVHLCSGISDDLDVLWQELAAELHRWLV